MGQLKETNLKLRMENNFPEPEYKCNDCLDRDWVVVNGKAKRCECFNNKLIKQIDSCIGKHHIENYNDFQNKFTQAMAKTDYSSCWIFGQSGLGKSALLSHWAKRRNNNILMIAGVDLVELFQIQNDEGQYINLKPKFDQYKMIVIDDIDKRWPFTNAVKNSVYKFIDDIVRNDSQQLLVTSNTSLDEFCSIWPENQRAPLLRRLKEKCFTLE